jgi:hypothetical protein
MTSQMKDTLDEISQLHANSGLETLGGTPLQEIKGKLDAIAAKMHVG